MQKKWEWNQKSLKFTAKHAHNDNIIGLCLHSPSTFFTSSEDSTIRMWDIRTQSSIKMIRNQCLTSQLSNPATNRENSVFIGSGPGLFQFDIRQQQIFIENISKKTEQPHYDEINQITYNEKYKEISCCDDQGDIRVYPLENIGNQLVAKYKLQQEHVNICNTVQYVNCESKIFEGKRLCVSGGYDSTLILWSIQQQNPIKKLPVADILQKYDINTQNPPFIHKLSAYGSSILMALQTGHIICSPVQDLKKPKFILQANLTKVTDCKVSSINGKNILLSCSMDNSFTLFDFQQRVDGLPKFIYKYGTIDEPVQVEILNTTILLVANSPSLSFYQLKL